MVDKILNKLYKFRNFEEFSRHDGFQLLKDAFGICNFEIEDESEKLNTLMNYFANIFISEKLFEPALDLYNVKINYFQKDYNNQYLREAYQQVEQVFDKIKCSLEFSKSNFEPDFKYFQSTFIVFLKNCSSFISARSKEISKLDGKDAKEECKILKEESQLQASHIQKYLETMYINFEAIYSRTKVLSLTDELTKLHNRRYLYQHYLKYFYLAARLKMHFSVIMMDLDKFKRINDTYGHHKGDEVLRTVAAVIHDSFRKSDIKIRIGGDEFIILLFDKNINNTRRIAKVVLDKIEGLEFLSDYGEKFNVGISVGISNNEVKDLDESEDFRPHFDLMIKEADKAMYHSKNKKNKITIYTKELG